MARLTINPIDAPNFLPAASILNSAVANFTNAANGIGGGLTAFGDIQRQNASAAALPILARVANEQGVDAALGQVENQVAARNRSPELLAAMAALRSGALANEQSRAQTGGVNARTDFTRENTRVLGAQEGRTAQTHQIGLDRDRALERLTPSLVDANLRANAGENPFQGGGAGSDGGDGGGPFGSLAPPSLAVSESGGNFRAQNDAVGSSGRKGHFGRSQIGLDRLDDAKNAGVIPKDMTPEQFLNDEAAQIRTENWHFNDIQNGIDSSGVAGAIGTSIKGIPVTRDGLVAVAHLGGQTGMRRFVATGGAYDPADANGKRLSAYLAEHAGNTTGPAGQVAQGGGAPAGSPLAGVDLTGLRPEDVLPLLSDTRTALDAARTGDDGNRQRDRAADRLEVTQAREDAPILRDEAARVELVKAADIVARDFRQLDPNMAVNLRRIEEDPNLTRLEKEAMKQATQEFVAANPTLFAGVNTLDGPATTAFAKADKAIRDALISQGAEGFVEQTALEQQRSGAGGGGAAGGAASGSEEGTSGSGTLTDEVANRKQRLEAANVDVNSPEIIELVAEEVDRTGLSRDTILEGILNSLGESTESSIVGGLRAADPTGLVSLATNALGFKDDRAVVDRDRLTKFLDQRSLTAVRQAEEENDIQQQATATTQAAEAELQQLKETLSQLQANRPSDLAERSAQILTRVDELTGAIIQADTDFGDSVNRVTRGFGVDEAKTPSETQDTPQATPRSNAARAINQAALEGQSIPTPNDTVVDSDASQLTQSIQRTGRGNEIDFRIGEIVNQLDSQIGSVVDRFLQRVVDFGGLSPSDQSAKDQNVAVSTEARDWFKTPDAKEIFARNPQLLNEARQDSVGFFLKFSGNTR